MDTPSGGEGFGAAANNLVSLLRDASAVWIEPAKVRRVAEAEADATRIKTKAEIGNEIARADARYRLETIEIRRQKNLAAIANGLPQGTGAHLRIEDTDWLAEFVESAKDTGDPDIQAIWSKILAGEMEKPGRCSKRTLHMVRSLSQAEALAIKEVANQICRLEDPEDGTSTFINGIIKRSEASTSPIHDYEAREIVLYSSKIPRGKNGIQRLIDCGFLTDADLQFSFRGEGPLEVEKFHLSETSTKAIKMGKYWTLSAKQLQPGLLLEMKTSKDKPQQMRTPGATIDFDAWPLSSEGEELWHILDVDPDEFFFDEIRGALHRGGLAVDASGGSDYYFEE